ncbi:MAG: AI-2E family transporter [Spirochaetales bacterium]|nr:AI-2E family transporter [Spirochaetales bacterium]
MSDERSEGARVHRAVFLVLFAGLFLLTVRIFQPFLSAIVWAGTAYAVLQPLYRRVATLPSGGERPKLARSALALAFASGTLLLVVVPLAVIALVLLGQVIDLTRSLGDTLGRAGDWFSGPGFAALSARIAELSGGALDPASIDLRGELGSTLQALGNGAVSIAADALGNVVEFAVTLAMFTVTLYFLFADGRQLLGAIVDAAPIRNEYTVFFIRKARDTGRDLAVGYIAVALAQGAVSFLIFLVMKVPGPLPLAVLVAISSLIPIAGTGLVWLPVGLARMASGQVAGGIAIIVLCAVFVSMLDNVLRPLLLRKRMNLHPLFIFFSIIGGLRLFGFNGLILGPLVLVLFFAGVDLYARAYGRTRRRDAETDDGRADQIPAETK